MKLLIAIPALNEEASIESVIERALKARDRIVERSPIDQVEITVVSDGSTDRTAELAATHAHSVELIVFERNRGYGAAIKEAWSRSDAEVLGFLDADGTCDPEFFAELCCALADQDADVVLGCRMNRHSRMPLLRRIGNTLFAWLLAAVSSRRVNDTASGMRVVRRSSLPRLMPLPDGLHFTPAMSARALLGEDLIIHEVNMSYREREGESKLHVLKDGLRFVNVILRTAVLYRPMRVFGLLAWASFGIAAGLMLGPTIHYIRYQSLQEWMIYRFIVGELAGIGFLLLVSAGYLSQRTVYLTLSARSEVTGVTKQLRRFFRWRGFWFVPLLLIVLGTSLVMYSFWERISTGQTFEHWSRFIAMSSLFSAALILAVTRSLDWFLDLVGERLAYQRSAEAAAVADVTSDAGVDWRRSSASTATAVNTTSAGSADTR